MTNSKDQLDGSPPSKKKSRPPKPQTALRGFLSKSLNQTTRERIFFNRLAFDLKIAAARVGYHMHLYEPDVDRDGFDIIVEDGETTRYLQLKAVLSSADKNYWQISVDLLRPRPDVAEFYGKAPVEGGRGGGVILIEIDDENEDGNVTYSYTDYDFLAAIAQGYLVEKKLLKSGKERFEPGYTEQAERALNRVWSAKRSETVDILRRQFLRLTDANALLEVIGLTSKGHFDVKFLRGGYGAYEIEAGGAVKTPFELDERAVSTFYHLRRLTALQQSAGPVRKGFSRFHIPDVKIPPDIHD
ncbi:hypothetical protein [Tabrizicola oligotrophica]|uniref:Rhodanese domain-containing protein n=1 Tax=Tabrizicola oligotrophica TaxID=2710650 RepID=A0A6M0QZ25_9RHOB|nr:hypothetical protein [Tabrizicola oligotrophica]NEY92281.1 hypothetical protein [Tabrizicola oligotrophica]